MISALYILLSLLITVLVAKRNDKWGFVLAQFPLLLNVTISWNGEMAFATIYFTSLVLAVMDLGRVRSCEVFTIIFTATVWIFNLYINTQNYLGLIIVYIGCKLFEIGMQTMDDNRMAKVGQGKELLYGMIAHGFCIVIILLAGSSLYFEEMLTSNTKVLIVSVVMINLILITNITYKEKQRENKIILKSYGLLESFLKVVALPYIFISRLSVIYRYNLTESYKVLLIVTMIVAMVTLIRDKTTNNINLYSIVKFNAFIIGLLTYMTEISDLYLFSLLALNFVVLAAFQIADVIKMKKVFMLSSTALAIGVSLYYVEKIMFSNNLFTSSLFLILVFTPLLLTVMDRKQYG